MDGEINTNWDDPRNWTEAKNGTETPVLFIPTACMDVIIPSGLQNYPILTAPATCADITMKDRAMIAGIHHLTYDNARVELALNVAERDRFIMWSAPMMSMYSGDYHFNIKAAPDIYKWGDVYMNYYQYRNPDGVPSSSADRHAFTATFGTLGEALPLGKAFNLKVVSTIANKDSLFVFPQTDTYYWDANGNIHSGLSRTNGSKFITHGQGAMFDLPVPNDVPPPNISIQGSVYVQIVNPYMAYLNANSFLNDFENSKVLVSNVYSIWDGETSSFTQIGTIGDKNNRFRVSTIPWVATSGNLFIPPLQSFFAYKVSSLGTALGTVRMSDAWTTTTPGSPYQLRADVPETNILRIKAVQDKSISYAVLHYNESTSPAYNSKEDIPKLFYQLEEDVIPLEVYTFAPTREVLAINSSSDFSQNVTLGLRTDKAGSVTLEFSGMATFGHNVYLIDHAENNKETDLQKNPTYTFTVAKKSASDKLIELNDRFSLRTIYTGIGLGNETTGTTDVSVTTRDGYIYVQTPQPVSSLQVYSLTGALVYSSAAKLDYFRIQTDGQQAYIIKVKMNDQYIIKKAFVK
ncbi:MAG: hypothetical protein LBL58_03165 [Tannerellaceae bacterium]|jgi:hypothetical protein|nr:hypothetical protein [Tannerellaceae bacterium]